MTEPRDLPPADFAEMVRASIGILTAKIAHDDDAVHMQLQAIIREQGDLSQGDVGVFAARMAKQVEAATLVAWTLLKSLAPRAEMTEEEMNRVLAQIAAEYER
ncbi:hypothetical protein [Microbacterium sp. NPDC064584]|uniref:hypothetical protein n=1 Tax=Microbacterium sp. NPDC064584 TaxID=3155817 RepID=UPI0034170176